MSKTGTLYIDSEGDKRGYYVYLHRETDSGSVFYVGKGNGKRAWKTDNRNRLWQNKVASLGDRWEVVIVQDDLCELEAFRLEAELVEQYGGSAEDGGKLTNLVAGGEDPMDFCLGLSLGPKLQAWHEAYWDARRFKNLSRKTKEEIVEQLRHDLEAIRRKLEELKGEVDAVSDETLSDSASDLDSILYNVTATARDFLRRRESWKTFAMNFEDTVRELAPDYIDELHLTIRPLAESAAAVAKSLFDQIDSGNRQEAVDIANRSRDASDQ